MLNFDSNYTLNVNKLIADHQLWHVFYDRQIQESCFLSCYFIIIIIIMILSIAIFIKVNAKSWRKNLNHTYWATRVPDDNYIGNLCAKFIAIENWEFNRNKTQMVKERNQNQKEK